MPDAAPDLAPDLVSDPTDDDADLGFAESPQTLEALFRDYNRNDIRARLAAWLADNPVGKEWPGI